MNIEVQKIELVKMILNTDNIDILNSIRQIFAKDDFWETLSSAQKEDIEAGIIEADNGEVVDYSEFMKKYR